MFRTYPEAELPLPATLAKRGERSWHWIELPIRITYFLVTFQKVDNQHQFAHTLMFSDIRSVLQAAEETDDFFRLERVDVLIPAYRHSGAGYKLEQIKEVWESDDDYQAISFLLADGTRIQDLDCGCDGKQKAKLNLVARF